MQTNHGAPYRMKLRTPMSLKWGSNSTHVSSSEPTFKQSEAFPAGAPPKLRTGVPCPWECLEQAGIVTSIASQVGAGDWPYGGQPLWVSASMIGLKAQR